tara:strand:- start:2327 stop:3046 length:720 start_codon:yes stop_codon:yes gene_type:complete
MLYDKDQKKTFKKVVKKLKEIEIDGESTQHLLQKIGHEEQMLRQLIMSMPIDDVITLFKERVEYERDCGNTIISPIDTNIEHRLKMINDDLRVIYQAIPKNMLAEPTPNNDNLEQCFLNIEIACDLKNDESLAWGLYLDNKTMGEKINEFLKELDDTEEYFEFNRIHGTCQLVCSGSSTVIECTPFYDNNACIQIVELENNDEKAIFKIPYSEPINDVELVVFKKFYIELIQFFIKTLN